MSLSGSAGWAFAEPEKAAMRQTRTSIRRRTLDLIKHNDSRRDVIDLEALKICLSGAKNSVKGTYTLSRPGRNGHSPTLGSGGDSRGFPHAVRPGAQNPESWSGDQVGL